MASKKAAAGNQRTIFIVDDYPDYRPTLGEVLTEEGSCPVLVGAAEALLSSLNCKLPSVIVTDAAMPGVSGAQLLTTLRKNDRWRGIPVVVMAGSNDTALPLRLEASIVCKPDADELLREIFLVLDRLPPTTIVTSRRGDVSG